MEYEWTAVVGLIGSIMGSASTVLVSWMRRRNRRALAAKTEALARRIDSDAATILSGAWAPIVAAYERQVVALTVTTEGLRLEVATWRQEAESWRKAAGALEDLVDDMKQRLATLERENRDQRVHIEEVQELLRERARSPRASGLEVPSGSVPVLVTPPALSGPALSAGALTADVLSTTPPAGVPVEPVEERGDK